MKKFFVSIWKAIKNEWKKSLKALYVIVPLGVVAYLGYKYVKDPNNFLQKKDVEKAKEKIKVAQETVETSKEVRKEVTAEVIKIQAKSKVRYSDYEESNHNVEDLEIISHEFEKKLIDRKNTSSSFLKKRTDG